MYRITKQVVVSLICCTLFLSCVETETKRTTKKVDASNVKVYQVDPDKPRMRLALTVPDFVEVDIASMLFVEIDDGVSRYGFPGDVFAADTSAAAGFLYSPWINTPDSGQLTMSFNLAYSNGAIIVSDRMIINLVPESFWEIEMGIQDHDPCPGLPDSPLCRSYSLPRDVESSGDGQFYVAWSSMPIVAPTNNKE